MARLLSTLCFALAAIGFALTSYVFSDWNFRPAILPFPGPGHAVATSFNITTSGTFRLEFDVPRPADYEESVDMPNLPPIPVDLRLQVEQSGKSIADIHVTSLRQMGEYAFGNIDMYVAQPAVPLARGEYDVRLTAQGSTPAPVGGAIVYFSRDTPDTEAFLAASFVRWASWAAFIAAVAFFLWGARPNKSSKRTR